MHSASHEAGTEALLTSQTVSTVLVIFMEIRSTAFAKTIIDIEIFDNLFDYFSERFLEVSKKIAQKRAPYACAIEAPAANYSNQEQHQDDASNNLTQIMILSWKLQCMENEDDVLSRDRENFEGL